MCTLAIYFQTGAAFPVVVAANRDEFFARPARPPQRLADDPWVVAGQDAVAGGTWLGVNAHGVVAGILNRRTNHPPDPTRRSRGLLCLEALRTSSVRVAATQVAGQPGTLYNPFNLLIASPATATVVGNASGAMACTPLSPGLHLLTNLELDDPECPRIAKSYSLFAAAGRHIDAKDSSALLRRLREILSDHSTPLDPRSEGPPNNLCVHTERFGTRSSTVLIYVQAEQRFRLWHANGAPCVTPFEEIALPAAQIA